MCRYEAASGTCIVGRAVHASGSSGSLLQRCSLVRSESYASYALTNVTSQTAFWLIYVSAAFLQTRLGLCTPVAALTSSCSSAAWCDQLIMQSMLSPMSSPRTQSDQCLCLWAMAPRRC